jgi:hypothetical protein
MGSISNKTDGILSAIAEVYNRATYMPEMREAMPKWDTHLGALLDYHDLCAIRAT